MTSAQLGGALILAVAMGVFFYLSTRDDDGGAV